MSLGRNWANHLTNYTLQGRPLWGALHTASPTDAGSLSTELSTDGTGYSRVNLTGLLSPADLSSGQAILNEVINIGPAQVDWPMVTHFAIWPSETGGAGLVYAFGPLSTAEIINTGQQFQRVPGQMIFRLF